MLESLCESASANFLQEKEVDDQVYGIFLPIDIQVL